MTTYKLYMDPKIRKILRQARKEANRRKIQDWRAKHVRNLRSPAHQLEKEKQTYA